MSTTAHDLDIEKRLDMDHRLALHSRSVQQPLRPDRDHPPVIVVLSDPPSETTQAARDHGFESLIPPAWDVDRVHTVEGAAAAVETDTIDGCIVSAAIGDLEKLRLLERLRTLDPHLLTLFISPQDHPDATIGVAVWNLAQIDYHTLTLHPDQVGSALEALVTEHRLNRRARGSEQQGVDSETDNTVRDRFEIMEAYLITTGGKLLANYQTEHLATDYSAVDADLFGAMFTVFSLFFTDLFKQTPGQLRTIDYKTLKIVVEPTAHCYLVMIGRGEITTDARARIAHTAERIGEEYGPMVEHWSGQMALLAPVHELLAALVDTER